MAEDNTKRVSMLKHLKLYARFSLLLTFLVSGPLFAQGTIEKCQDAEGKWHYGDTAGAACEKSKITVLDKKGIKVKEIDRPPSLEEIEAREAEKQRQAALDAEQKERAIARQRILRVYPDEASIIRARDQRISGLDQNITLNEQLLDELRLRKKEIDKAPKPRNEKALVRRTQQLQNIQEDIDHYTTSISRLREDREKVQNKYKLVLEEFRDLTGTAPADAAATK
jgi:hypothetical protein